MKLRIDKRSELLAPGTATFTLDIRLLIPSACSTTSPCTTTTCGMKAPTLPSPVENA